MPPNRWKKFVDDLLTFGTRSRFGSAARAGPRSIPELDGVVPVAGITVPTHPLVPDTRDEISGE